MSDHSTQAAWHVLVVKMRFVTQLSTKVLNREKLSWLQRGWWLSTTCATVQQPIPNVATKTHAVAISRTIGVHAQAVIPKAHSSLLPEHQFV